MSRWPAKAHSTGSSGNAWKAESSRNGGTKGFDTLAVGFALYETLPFSQNRSFLRAEVRSCLKSALSMT
jgi:hypothetical protein